MDNQDPILGRFYPNAVKILSYSTDFRKSEEILVDIDELVNESFGKPFKCMITSANKYEDHSRTYLDIECENRELKLQLKSFISNSSARNLKILIKMVHLHRYYSSSRLYYLTLPGLKAKKVFINENDESSEWNRRRSKWVQV